MKQSQLTEHTALWLGMSAASVNSFGRFLREGGILSAGGRGGAAPDMTTDDKIALFVAVLACGTARTCAKDLPRLLALSANRSLSKKDELHRPDFFHRDNLKDALLRMFQNIQDGGLEQWIAFMGSELERIGSKFQTADVDPLQLTVTFEVDANYVQIRLGARIFDDGGKRDVPLNHVIQTTLEFGRDPTSPVAGYSRHIRELSYERLAGWGTCLTDGTL